MTKSDRFACVAAFVVSALVAGQALAQTKCPEGQTASGECANSSLATSMRQRAVVFTQPKLSFTGGPAAQSSADHQDTRAGRLLERPYNQYGPPPSSPTMATAPGPGTGPVTGPGTGPGTYPGTGGGVTSDARLKRDIAQLTCLDSGICLYRFRYMWSDVFYVGVMAQEVQRIVPAAVTRGSDGYLRVHYDRLGLTFQTWNEWAEMTDAKPAFAAMKP